MKTSKHTRSLNTLLPLLLPVAVLLTGCGTLFQGGTQRARFESDPGGAEVEVRGKPTGEPLVTLTLSRGQSHLGGINQEGYERYNVTLIKKPKIIWFIGGPFAAIDHVTGALYKLEPGTVSADLEEE